MNTHTNDNSSSAELDKCITWQYDKATNLVAFIGMLGDFFAQSTESLWDSWKAKVNDIDTADDFGLSVWGKILNCRRPIINIGGNDVNLGTEKYRAVLKARAQLLASHGTVPDYKAYIETAFDGHFIVHDGNDMGITFVATDDATDEEVALADQFPDIAFLFPCGVRSSSVTDPASIGFKGQQTNDPGDTPVECFGLANFHSVKSEYEVTLDYYDGDEHVVETQMVAYGGNAILPSSYARTGYTFIGWSDQTTNITSDRTIRAIYEATQIEVTLEYFKSDCTKVTATQTVTYGGSAIPPEDDFVPDGYSFYDWDSGLGNITEAKTIKARYSPAPIEITAANADEFGIDLYSKTSNHGLFYSADGSKWTPVVTGGCKVYANRLLIKAIGNSNLTGFSIDVRPNSRNEWNTELNLSGNVMSLHCDVFTGLGGGKAFAEDIFAWRGNKRNGVKFNINAKFPQTELTENCYKNMFLGVVGGGDINLPATELKSGCYEGMFSVWGVMNSDVSANENRVLKINLPATELVENCYKYMFANLSDIKIDITVGFTKWNDDVNATTNWMSDRIIGGNFNFPTGLVAELGPNRIPYFVNLNEIRTLTFIAQSASTQISMKVVGTPPRVTLETSTDGENWTPFIPGTTTITLANVGDIVYFRNGDTVNKQFASSDGTAYRYFVTSKDVYCTGDVMGLLDYGYDEMPRLYQRTFNDLFGNSKILTPPSLPATELADYCYKEMFVNASKLILAPGLPAAEMKPYCYYNMFSGCYAMKKIFNLNHVTKAADHCFEYMLHSCNSFKMSKTRPAGGADGFMFKSDIVTADAWNSNMYYNSTIEDPGTITPGTLYYINY